MTNRILSSSPTSHSPPSSPLSHTSSASVDNYSEKSTNKNTKSIEMDDDIDEDTPIAPTTKKRNNKKTKTLEMDDDMDDDMDDEIDEDSPIAPTTKKRNNKKTKTLEMDDDMDDDIDEDSPIAPTTKKRNNKNTKSIEMADDMDIDEDSPIASTTKKRKSITKSKPKTTPAKKSKTPPAKKVKSEPQSAKNSPSKSVKAEKKDSKNKANVKDEEDAQEEQEEEYKWWLEETRDDSIKWNTLQHSGVLFPPEYIPHGIKMKYDGKDVDLSPEGEEVATFYAALIGTDYVDNPTFRKNFFDDFLNILKKEKSVIKVYEKCDFTPITNYLEDLKIKKKAMTKEEKKAIKEEKLKIEEEYGYAYLDGRKEKVGNFRVEPPGLFRGRGEHPKTGSLKARVQPEQITLNIGKDAKIPDPPEGHQWGQIVHDNTVTWLAYWKENVNDNFKYVFLAANSSLKGQSDFKKFEKARELKKHINRIRTEYNLELKDKQMLVRQRATALYLIDRFALRAGNEKGDDEADTVGCCSLRFEHVTLEPPNRVIFDFLGKDSIRYYNEVEVDDQVFKNLKIFKREPKKDGDLLFDRLNTGLLNKHLSKIMPGLSAKVFRTYNASYTFQEELKNTPADGSIADKLLAYNRANRQVAVLCNHQRAVGKGHGGQMMKLKDKVLALKYDRQQVKDKMLEIEPKLKKSRPEISEYESELDDEFIERHLLALEEKEKKTLETKLIKENEKRKENGEEEILEIDLEKVSRKTSLPTDMEKLEKKYEQITERIKVMKTNLIDKDENKTTALGTSKINYIDPRISATWCAKHNFPIEKIFAKTLRDKFKWAMESTKDWIF